ncbi:hypothetical protein F5B19DRAFT_440177 [Rostrohypoxylon terebratum]|nr:hypothetical protein F5B19DRAFT_440177 [Rostrohypoxylon terebratum]
MGWSHRSYCFAGPCIAMTRHLCFIPFYFFRSLKDPAKVSHCHSRLLTGSHRLSSRPNPDIFDCYTTTHILHICTFVNYYPLLAVIAAFWH